LPCCRADAPADEFITLKEAPRAVGL
jgi:hypothetical protein